MRLASLVLWRGLLTMIVALVLTGTGEAQSFKRKAAATTAKATVKKKPRAKPAEPRRPMP